MQLDCRNCGAPLGATELQPERGIATCRFCTTVTRLPKPPAPPHRSAKPLVPRPAGITVEETPDGLRILRRWFTPALFFLLFFCIAWDSFLIFWYSMALGGGGHGPPFPFNLIMIVFPAAHVAVGVGLTYFTIAGFFNRTTIEADAHELRVSHGPVPWKGNWAVPADDVEQLYCQRDTSRSRNSDGHSTYKLHAVLKGGARKTLMSHVSEADQVRYVEQELEKHLRIADRRVAGELR